MPWQRDKGANNHQLAEPQLSLSSAQLTKQERGTNLLSWPSYLPKSFLIKEKQGNTGGVEMKHKD